MDRKQPSKNVKSKKIDLKLNEQRSQKDKPGRLSTQIKGTKQKQHKASKENNVKSSNQGKHVIVGQNILDVATLLFVIDSCGNEYGDLVNKLRGYLDAPQRLSSAEGMGLPRINPFQLKENGHEDNMRLETESQSSLSFQPNSEAGKNKFELLINKFQEIVEKITPLLCDLKDTFRGFPDILKARLQEIQADLKHGVQTCTDDDKNRDIEEVRKTIKNLYEDLWNPMSTFSEEVHHLLRELDKDETKKILASQKKAMQNLQQQQLPKLNHRVQSMREIRPRITEHRRQRSAENTNQRVKSAALKPITLEIGKIGIQEQSQNLAYSRMSSWGHNASSYYT
ncbi:uncharacterized protein LOC117116168 [Anneissia japonica]|uniref:uncharacterized protein LOC117116168 n=1 Tax=Anneissia japonica TaxID=1529436 RepID=UPI0014259151|nr:uncharacterized protein LOC117116168 [Anneissia japonica]